MRPEIEALARHRLSRAHETLTEGEQLLAQSKLMGAVNRLYCGLLWGSGASGDERRGFLEAQRGDLLVSEALCENRAL